MALSPPREGGVASLKPFIAEFASGAVFGAALVGSGVYAPSIIKMQMTFRSNVMVVVMMGGSATSARVVKLLENTRATDRLKLLRRSYPPPNSIGLFPYDSNVLGGAMIGLGMGMTGSCPGTALVQAGMGMMQGLLVLAGGVLGATAFLRLQMPSTSLRSEAQANEANLHHDSSPSAPAWWKARDLATAFGLPQAVLLVIWIAMCLTVTQFALIQDESVRVIPSTGLVWPIYGGLLIGFAQLITTVFAGHSLGASAAYEDVAQWILKKCTWTSTAATPLITPSLVFSAGVIAAAAALSRLSGPGVWENGQTLSLIQRREATFAILGGVSMGFGARLAKGCTSGHGISGVARFSIASLISTAALFSAGIMTTNLLDRAGIW